VALAIMRNLFRSSSPTTEATATLQQLGPQAGRVELELQIQFQLALGLLVRHPVQRSAVLARLEALIKVSPEGAFMAGMAKRCLDLRRLVNSSSLTAEELVAHLGPMVDASEMLSADPILEVLQVYVSFLLLCADRFDLVDPSLRSVIDRAAEYRNKSAERDALRLLTISLIWQGRLTEAEDLCRRQRLLAAEMTTPTTVVGLSDVLLAQGRSSEAARLLDDLRPELIEEPVMRAIAYTERGRLLLDCDLIGDAFGEFNQARTIMWSIGVAVPGWIPWRSAVAFKHARDGRLSHADALVDEQLRWARRFGAGRALGSTLRAKAASTPDARDKVALLTEAVAVIDSSKLRLESARALIDLGTALAQAGEQEHARTVLRRGATLASQSGAQRLVEEAGAQLRATGARPRRLGRTGIDSLTPAELKVAQLAAMARTNQAIADELFVSIKTVEGHLAKAYRKLGIRSRRELGEALRSVSSDGDDEIATAV